MILPDVNVLIYAFRADAAHHSLCKTWLENICAQESRFGISPLTLSALLRIVTNDKIHSQPSLHQDVFDFANSLLTMPNCVKVEPRDHHWEIFQKLCVEANIRGPNVSDAWYGALAIEWNCEWITFDSDYSKFPGLKWRMPSLNK